VLKKLLYVIPVVFRGKQYKLFALGIILLACRKYNWPMTVQKIAKVAKLKKTRTLNNLLRTMKKLLPEYTLYTSNPINFLPKISKSLLLNKNARKLASFIVDKITRKNLLVGTHPNTIAGAAIFWAKKLLKEEIDINQLAKAADCATQTIRNIYYKMESQKDAIFL
jgi:transcription initiation factor TFIIIB Brf1 subunit/transcription initiation factor TFIIB